MAQRVSTRGPLTRSEIVDAALALAEEQGLEALSLHKIAAALGVAAMSLYNHLADKNDLLDRMADAILDGVVLPDAIDDLEWTEGLRELGRAFRAAALQYPRSSMLALTRRPNSPSALRLAEATLGLLHRGGFDPAMSVRLLRVFVAFLSGALLREVTLSSDVTAPRTDGLPHVAEAADALTVIDHAAEFEFALDLMATALHGCPRSKPPMLH